MRIAAVDLGSNSFHLVIVDVRPDGTFTPLVREKAMLRLGDGVAREGRIPDDDAELALETLRRFRSLADAAGADEIVACATSAIREASNSAELVERAEREASIAIRVISGQEEARLIFGAVRASLLLHPAPAVCLDLGGGSLEVTVGDTAALAWATSVKLGVARLTTELVRDDPPTEADLRRLSGRIHDVLGPVAAEVARFAPQMLVGTSGTFCDLARVVAVRRSGSAPVSINQFAMTLTELEVLADEALPLPAGKRRRIPGLDAKRADQLPAGLTVAIESMRLLGFDTMTVGEWALREGIVLDAIDRHDPADWGDDPRAIRRSSVRDLAVRCGVDTDHAAHVARLATAVFDGTAAVHGLGGEHRELLEHAASLHDIGEHVDHDDHHKHSAYLVQHGRLRGFTPDEVAVLATLARFHRKGEPKTSFEPYKALDDDERSAATWLLACLQLADGIEHGHTRAVHDVRIDLAGDAVGVSLVATGDADLALWGARRKLALFERLVDRPVEVRVLTA